MNCARPLSVSGEYVPRINGIWYDDSRLTSDSRCKGWPGDQLDSPWMFRRHHSERGPRKIASKVCTRMGIRLVVEVLVRRPCRLWLVTRSRGCWLTSVWTADSLALASVGPDLTGPTSQRGSSSPCQSHDATLLGGTVRTTREHLVNSAPRFTGRRNGNDSHRLRRDPCSP